MASSLLTRSVLALALLIPAAGCQRIDRGDDSYITGLRIMDVKASPPEVAAGGTTTLTVLTVDTMGRAIDAAWTYCEDAPPTGQRFNTDCVVNDTAPYIYPFGNGTSASLVMPSVDPAILGSPDQTGGVYLPIRVKVTAGMDQQIAVYHLRVGMTGTMPNNNPSMFGIYQVVKGAGLGDGGTPPDLTVLPDGGFASGSDELIPLDPVNPTPVHTGDKLILRAMYTASSTESYTTTRMTADGGTSTRMNKERVDTTFYSTAGTIGFTMGTGGGTDGGSGGGPPGGGFGGQRPDTTLTIDASLPAVGGTIDLWAIGRDGRGGTDYLHRTLVLQ